jgi:hypothetical protein
MPRNQRITLLALAAVVVVIAAVVAIASSGGDDTSTTVTETTIVTTTTTPAGAATATTPPETVTETETVTTPPTTTAPAAPPLVVVKDGQPVGGVQKLEFTKGGTIDFLVRSDTPGEIHFHGYDVHRDVPEGGGTVRFRLPAKFDGRFVVELEETGTEIAEVEVQQ